MNNVLAAVMRPKVYIPVVVILIAIVAYLSLPKSHEADVRSINAQAGTQKQRDAFDKQKIDALQDMATRITNYYTTTRQNYPLGTTSGWKDIINNVPLNNSFIDPYTKTIYTFSPKDTDPYFGQVQYYPGGTCDTKTQTFKKGTFRSIALRTRLYNAYHCASTVEIQATSSKQD